jgi:hypothetical protein
MYIGGMRDRRRIRSYDQSRNTICGSSISLNLSTFVTQPSLNFALMPNASPKPRSISSNYISSSSLPHHPYPFSRPVAYPQYSCHSPELYASSSINLLLRLKKLSSNLTKSSHLDQTCSTAITSDHCRVPHRCNISLRPPIASMRTHLIPLKPYSVPYLVACWLNKQEPRPAGTIAKLAILSKYQYLKIVPILYSTLVLGGDHEHHCLRIPYAVIILDTADTFPMAREAVQDRTFWRSGNIWYSMTRRLYLLSLAKTIYLVGPPPTLLSCDIVADLDVNLFPRAHCIVFGTGVVEAIGAMPRNVLGQKLDPPYSCVSTDEMVNSLNKFRPVWLNALVAITRPRRLHIHYRQWDYREVAKMDHSNECDCCSFAHRMYFLGPPYQWASLEVLIVHGIVDQVLPVILNCKNIYIFSSHLTKSAVTDDPTDDGPPTPAPNPASLVEVDPNAEYVLGLPGVSWGYRRGTLGRIMLSLRQVMGHTTFAKKAYNGILPRQFALRFYNVAGHVRFDPDDKEVPTQISLTRESFLEDAEAARRYHISCNPSIKGVIPYRARWIDLKVSTAKYHPKCVEGQDHTSRLS